jgi:hypothetical protein
MAIVTLTTDLGMKDYYVASVKGAIYSRIPGVNIIDISHEIPAFDIAVASYTLENCYADFPIGSVHIIGVNTASQGDQNIRHLVGKKNGHYFICSDNGLFSILFNNQLDEVYEISYQDLSQVVNFATKEVFAPVACELLEGVGIETLGYPVEELKENLLFKASNQDDNSIRGMAIYIDHFGNIITNIHQDLFDETQKGRNYRIILRKTKDIKEDVTHIHSTYSSVEKGEIVAFFSHNGYLEIAVNEGRANKLLGIQLNEPIWIEFD